MRTLTPDYTPLRREPTSAERIALTLMFEARRTVTSRPPISLGGPKWSRPQ